MKISAVPHGFIEDAADTPFSQPSRRICWERDPIRWLIIHRPLESLDNVWTRYHRGIITDKCNIEDYKLKFLFRGLIFAVRNTFDL